MRKVTNYTIGKESVEYMLKGKRFNPCLEITFRDKTGRHRHKLGAGYSDDIHVYRENTETLVLTQNPRLGYVGLKVFHGDKEACEIFLEDYQVKEILGRQDLAPFTMIRRLLNYLYL